MKKDMAVSINLNGVDGASSKVKSVIDKVSALTSKAQIASAKLKTVTITQNQIRSFETLTAKTNDAKVALEAARQKATALEKAVAMGEKVKTELGKANKAVKDLEAQYTGLTDKVRKSEQALKAKGVETSRLTEHTRQLTAESAKLQRVTEAYNKAESAKARARSMAVSGAAAMGVGGGILAGVGTTVRAFAEAETAATGLKTAMMDSTGRVSADFERMNALATSLGNRLPGTTADFQDMMQMLVRQGMPARTILAGTGEAAAYLGVQLRMAPAAAAEFAAKMQDALRAPSEDMMGVMDVIQRTFYAGVDSGNMLNAFSKVSAGMDILRIKGVEGARVIAPLLAMADQSGLVGEASGNALRKVLQLSMDRDATREYGMDFTDGKGEHAGLPAMFAQLSKLKTMSTERRLEAIKDIFGNDAETIQMLTLMIEKGQSGYDEMVGKLQGQADLKRRVDESLGTLSALYEATSGTWTNVKAAFGQTLGPELKAATVWLGETTAKMQAWISENPKAAKAIAMVVAGLGVLLVVGGAITVALAGLLVSFATFKLAGLLLLPGLKAGLLGVGKAFLDVLAGARVVAGFLAGGLLTAVKAVFAFLMANPIVLVIMAIIGALYLLYRNWDTVVAFLASSWAKLVELFQGARDLGSQIMDGMISGITSKASALWESLKATVSGAVDKVRNFLGIRSPSRLFMEIGGHTTSGMALGITRGAPAAVESARRMAAGITVAGAATLGAGMAAAGTGAPGAVGPGGSGAVSFGPVSIVINGTGLDPEAIAKAVDRRLRALATQTKTEQQARFFDD
jgi:TP901 family phage tail tape measure protein